MLQRRIGRCAPAAGRRVGQPEGRTTERPALAGGAGAEPRGSEWAGQVRARLDEYTGRFGRRRWAIPVCRPQRAASGLRPGPPARGPGRPIRAPAGPGCVRGLGRPEPRPPASTGRPAATTIDSRRPGSARQFCGGRRLEPGGGDAPALRAVGVPPNWQGVIRRSRSADRLVWSGRRRSRPETWAAGGDVDQPFRHLQLR